MCRTIITSLVISAKAGVQYRILEKYHFLDKSFIHVDGSACCSAITNSDPVSAVDACADRCSSSIACTAWVYQPSTGMCWVGTAAEPEGLIPIPANDRIAGLAPSGKLATSIMKDRKETGALLTQQQPRGLGVVLGVGHGEFVTELLESWNGGLYLVDPYIHIYKGYDDPANVDDKTHQLIYERIRADLHKQYEFRHVIVRDFSHSFAEVWTKKNLPRPTFVYVDGNHATEAVRRDLGAWWDLLAPGGVIAGSMYIDDPSKRIGVKGAVNTWFSQAHGGIPVFATGGLYPDWVVFKPID